MRSRKETNFELRRDTDNTACGIARQRCHTSKKMPYSVNLKLPVPETDTGRLVENTKGRERTLSKELGKLTP